jgi:hypothetical protein
MVTIAAVVASIGKVPNVLVLSLPSIPFIVVISSRREARQKSKLTIRFDWIEYSVYFTPLFSASFFHINTILHDVPHLCVEKM